MTDDDKPTIDLATTVQLIEELELRIDDFVFIGLTHIRGSEFSQTRFYHGNPFILEMLAGHVADDLGAINHGNLFGHAD